ncbi:ML domain-containing protein [Actinomadura napierensis]|uniref:MD-2-related lipid-recognition domain-containing protein n=1 Tax=Actinomadura napierensis TaxID=267854 RepID=A0ABN2YBN6_9ACTN
MTSLTWENRGTPDDVLAIDDVVFAPSEPNPGSALTITITGTTGQAIAEGATVLLEAKLGLIKLLSKTFDLLQEIRNGSQVSLTTGLDDTGAIPAGWVELVVSFDPLPREIPRAKFTVMADARTADEDDLFALYFTCDLTKK